MRKNKNGAHIKKKKTKKQLGKQSYSVTPEEVLEKIIKKKGEHWASSVKGKTLDKEGEIASSHNCTVNNQVTMNKL